MTRLSIGSKNDKKNWFPKRKYIRMNCVGLTTFYCNSKVYIKIFSGNHEKNIFNN